MKPEYNIGSPMRLLIIDDDEVDRMAIKRHFFSIKDIKAEEAETGEAALLLLKKNEFDCIFLDYRLPDMDGVTFLERIYNRQSDLCPCPVIMLTGQGSESVMLDALRFGAQDYLMKDNLTPAGIQISVLKARETFDLKKSRKRAEEQIHQAHKMDAVGQLTSGIAHDFNNILTVVLGNTRLLKYKIERQAGDASEEYKKKIIAIETAANKGAELIRKLMVFTRQQPPRQEIFDVNSQILETLSLVEHLMGKSVELLFTGCEDIWPVRADPGQFENMIINLCINARDAMNGSGRLAIETANVELPKKDFSDDSSIRPGPYILLTVSDTGEGMDQEIIARIFEPFFTTKPLGEGAGLGLSMIYGFVEQAGGYIRVLSNKGHGSAFKIYLPKYLAEPETQSSLEKTLIQKNESSFEQGEACETRKNSSY